VGPGALLRQSSRKDVAPSVMMDFNMFPPLENLMWFCPYLRTETRIPSFLIIKGSKT